MAGGGIDNNEVMNEFFEELFSYALRPYDFVVWAFPWSEPGTLLADRKGPEGWQVEALLTLQSKLLAGPHSTDAEARYVGEAIQTAIKSGHDVGKTAFLSWVSWWALTTRPMTRGRATANTEKQLRTILWSELSKWHSLFIGNFLFEWTATSIYRKGVDGPNWRLDAIPWSEHNLDAFSGLHNYGGRVFVLFDEASGIHDGIWERVDGVMHEANTELIWIATSNPTRNHGRFYECFNRFSESWTGISVDSRSVSFTNKSKIDKAIAQWGLDSDYVKVRYLGEFPDAASTQLIPIETIKLARTRAITTYHFEALVLGVDVARFGSNESVLTYRRGKDARTIPTERYRGLSTVELGNKVATAILAKEVDAVFIDEGGVGGGVVDFVRSLGHSVIGVNFGGKPGSAPNGIFCFNKRAEMYVALKEWLREGGCLEDSEDLQNQLVTIEYFFRSGKREIQLIPKEDMETEGFDSPDVADALALTFAYPASPKAFARRGRQVESNYDPLSFEQIKNWEAA